MRKENYIRYLPSWWCTFDINPNYVSGDLEILKDKEVKKLSIYKICTNEKEKLTMVKYLQKRTITIEECFMEMI